MNNNSIKTPRAAFGKLLLNESRLAWRTPICIGSGLGVPLLLLVVFGSIPVLRVASSDLGGFSYFALSFPILMDVTILTLSIMMLPRSLIKYREMGILRRLSVTPVPPSWLLAAQIVINLAIVVAGLIILAAAGVTAFGLEPQKNTLGFMLATLFIMASLFAIGFCIAAIVRNDAVAQESGTLLFFALMFFGGIWIPRSLMPAELINISNWLPLGASVDAIQRAMQGLFPSLQSILVLTAYTLVFGYLAVRYFKRE
jgi:ABC-2 type transport system permease protein